MQDKILDIKTNIDELENISQFIADLAVEWQISDKTVFNLNLVLEELFSNIVFYGYDDLDEHDVSIHFQNIENQIFVEISDDAKEFNPLDISAENEVEKPLEERKIGGLGIHLLKKLMTNIEYIRLNDKNILSFTC